MNGILGILIIAFATAGLAGCASKAPQPNQAAPVNAPPKDVAPHFPGLDGCFILYDLKTNEFVEVFNKAACKKRQPACSTFKVPLALMAFDAGILKDETSGFKWDGVSRVIPDWNKDADATSWLRDSVVWFSQKITPLLGRPKIQSYLKSFNYGNQDFSGGLENAWLTRSDFLKKKPKTTLKISAFDQIDFLKRLWAYQLPVSKHATDVTLKIIPAEASPGGFTLQGKTGSGFVGRHGKQRLGWYVAHLQGNSQEYLAVVSFTDQREGEGGLLAGRQSRDILKAILGERGLW